MLKKKLSTFFLCASLLVYNIPFNSTVFASSVNQNTVDIQDVTLAKTDESSINKNINELLSLKYEILKTGKVKDYSDIVKDSNLLELINKKSNFDVEWFKKFNGKTDGYTSNVTITNLTKTATNTYVANVLYSVEFKLKGANFTSKSTGEKYRFEIKYEDGKWYITKMLDLNENDNISTDQQTNQANSSTTDTNNTSFLDYDSTINSEIETIEDKSNNLDTYYQSFIQSEPENSNSQTSNIINLTSYTGYNATNAVAYAHKYAYSPNYSTYPGSLTYVNAGEDCTDFVSQCVLAGGIPASQYWYAYSNAWNTVIGFYNYMYSNGYASSVTGPRGNGTMGARAGDVVQFYSPSKSTWSHSVILTGTVSGGTWVYCAHSIARLDYPLYAAYDQGGYTNLRTLKFYH